MEKRIKMLFACLFLFVGMAMAQTKVSGTVLSYEDNEPVVGAAVRVVGTNTGAITDVNGKFTITCPQGKNTLSISYVGMESIEVSARANMRILLKNDAQNLDEIVVVAYGTAKKQSITGAVSSIDAKEIDKRIATSVTGALEGAAPGVQVNNTYGEPGAEPTIRIRGIGSINGSNTPLYVVDGVIYSGNISDLNSNDIQSISVLKDAASSALYGNRAAAGVVIITTKAGRSTSNSSISLKVNHGFYGRGLKEYDRLGVKDWMETSWDAMKHYAMTGSLGLGEAEAAQYATEHLATDVIQNNIFNADPTQLFDANGNLTASVKPGYTDLDWEDNVERTGNRQEYNLDGNYTSDKVSVYSSIGYLKENGYIVGSDFERYTGRVNTTFTPNKWITSGLNVNASISKRHFNDNANGSYYANPFYVARYMAPVYPYYMHNDDGSILYDEFNQPVYDTTSPYLDNRNITYEIRKDKDESRRNVIDATAFATINLPYDFSLTVKGNMSRRTNNRTSYNNPEIGDGATNNGRLSAYNYEYNNYTMQELLNWGHDYGLHHVDVLLGHENFHYESKVNYGMNTNMAVDDLFVMSNFLTNSYFAGYDNEYATESYLSRVRYNFDQKYFFDASWRRDGSSRFHKDNRWGNFFSLGASWNAKKENFLKDVKWIDQSRLRVSYGEVGNDAGVSYYAYQALYYIDKNGGNPALMKQSLAANEIKWETTQTFDIALEGRLFDRLNYSIGYFDKRSKDLLFAVRLPLSAGSYPYNEDDYNMTIYKNIGTISNRGWEIAFDYDIFKGKKFSWNVGIDATFLSNKIIKLPDGNNILSGLHNYTEGRSLYDFYTYHFVGVDQMTGNSLYTLDPEMEETAAAAGELVEINGVKYTNDTAYGLRDFHDTALPTVYGSFHTNLSWNGLSASFLFTYSLGGKTYDGSYQSLMSTNAMSSGSAIHKDALKAWNGVPEGMTETSANRIDPNGIPAMNYDRSSKNNATSDRWLTNASYLVCKNISLSYSLPKSILNAWNVGINGITLNAGVENLFTITARKGMNPQYSFLGGSDDTYVTSRVFNFGMTLNF
ncbi:MAG: SusC/RagA family TonB-linked outer membrane protein [Prevotellaceae bacterium]|nr:SusC/RagA family TonB-linked outer membrane protein [Prevotellaceae bacterium]MDY5208716.1 SusC/RagA family TonB-linked outer membrane protein [Prevotella sp.]